MIRKILKWIGIVLGSLVGLIVLAFVTLYIIGGAKWSRIRWNHDVPVETIPMPTDPTSIARGEHIATIHMCGYCHTDPLSGHSETVPGLHFHAEAKRSGNRCPQALLFGYLTSIQATPAVESPPELQGTVAQDRLSDRPGRDDA